jgi:cation diffusion facilitator CzcD-associated flavoprotein CzcO
MVADAQDTAPPAPTLAREGVPIRDCREYKVIFIGAGLLGIHFAARIQQFGPGIKPVIYERNDNIGGTWHDNTYPGVACDVPSHGYTLSWAPWAGWSRFQAPGADCQRYAEFVASKTNIRDITKFNTRVLSANWDEDAAEWVVELEDVKTGAKTTDRAPVLINGSGVLSKPKKPVLPGMDLFKGPQLHSAQWGPAGTEALKGKRVALVGAGSTSLQILPEIQKVAAHVDQYFRSETWVVTPFGADVRAEHWSLDPMQAMTSDEEKFSNPFYSEDDKKKFAAEPDVMQKHRKDILDSTNKMFAAGLTELDSEMRKQAEALYVQMTTQKLAKRPDLLDLFLPKWSIGCRRLTPAVGYFQAVVSGNVDIVRTSAVEVTATGILGSDGKHREYDAIIWATGFDTSFYPSFGVHGRNGAKLYPEEARAYLTAHAEEMPNFFTIGGPGLMSFNGDYLGGLEKILDHILKFVFKLQRERYQTVCVKKQSVIDFTTWIDNYLERTVHNQSCSSWYKNGSKNGKVRAIWCGTSLHLFDALIEPCWEEFDWTRYPNEREGANRYAWLGNGRTRAELNGGDYTWYIPRVDAGNIAVPTPKASEPLRHLYEF